MSPALFAIGIASAIRNIDTRIREIAPTGRVFSYLDDVMVVVPAALADKAQVVVIEELTAAGLDINAGKTVLWTRDPNTPLRC